MKKLIFTADWHIKLGQKNVPIVWQKNRFYKFFSELLNLAYCRNMPRLVIGGDIFDRVPTVEELEVFFYFLTLVGKSGLKEVIIYSGNHEALKKNTTFLSNLKDIIEFTTDGICIVIDSFYSDSTLDILPYNKLKEFEKSPNTPKNKLLLTHVRGEITPHVVPEVDLNLFNPWELVLAGDLHSYTNSQRNILYPGSPMTTSFHREEVDSGVLIVDTETLEHEFVVLNLPQLLRKTISDPKLAIPTEFHHTIYELEGNIKDLATMEVDSSIVDKKITKKQYASKLNLTGSLEDELQVYCKDILKLEPVKIKTLIGCLHDYIKDVDLE